MILLCVVLVGLDLFPVGGSKEEWAAWTIRVPSAIATLFIGGLVHAVIARGPCTTPPPDDNERFQRPKFVAINNNDEDSNIADGDGDENDDALLLPSLV